MELSSDNLFAFVFRRYKQKENKNKPEPEPTFKISRRQNSPKVENKKLNESELKKYFHALIVNNSNISNVLYNSIDTLINECFNNLEYLSITNNYIRSLDFILNLPNLFYLDIHGNPLEELSALNTKNIFGYLRLSVEIYNEKKILNIYDLKCGIFDIDLRDKNTKKIFNLNNHHIGMINNEVNYIIDKIKYQETKIKSSKKKNKRQHRKTDDKRLSLLSVNSNLDTNNIEVKSEININQLIKNSPKQNLNGNINTIAENPITKIEIKNEFLLKIKNYFDDYQNILNKLLFLEYNKHPKDENKTRVNINKFNEAFSMKNFEENESYLQHEKNKLLLLFEIYKKLSIFNKDKNDNKYYIGNIYSINVNKNVDDIFIKEIKDNIMNQSQNTRACIIILISIIFYTLGTISEKMMSTIINYILRKYYKYDESKPFPDFTKLGNIHYLAFYYSTYDYIYKKIIEKGKIVNFNQYKDILNILQMKNLILKSNNLYQKLKENKTKDNNTEFCQFKKQRINYEIKFIKDLNIAKEFLVLIEFLCDYIIYEKIEEELINNSYPGEYSYLIELKETIEECEIQPNKDTVLSTSSLSVIKFQKSKKERIFNKFYFEKDKIKKIKNKDFKNFILNEMSNRSKVPNNYNSGNSMLINISNSNFNNTNNNIYSEEKEYNKNDELDVDEFFYVGGNSRNNNKLNKIQRNNNTSTYNLKNKENDNYKENLYMEEYDYSFKLPDLYQNQPKPYEEFEFLKKMIFDPTFLSQHARNVLKFEKRAKKLLKKYPNLNIRNLKNINIVENKGEEENPVKLVENEGAHTNFENYNSNNKKKNLNNQNINIESNSNENSSTNNNGKTFNSPITTSSPLNLKTQTKLQNLNKTNDKISLKMSIDKQNETQDIKMHEINKTVQHFNGKNRCYRHHFKKPFFEVPESFPGITLLKFGIKKNKSNPIRNIKLYAKKGPINNEIKEINKNNKKSYKQQIINKIKQTVKENFIRNCRRVVCPNPYYS